MIEDRATFGNLTDFPEGSATASAEVSHSSASHLVVVGRPHLYQQAAGFWTVGEQSGS